MRYILWFLVWAVAFATAQDKTSGAFSWENLDDLVAFCAFTEGVNCGDSATVPSYLPLPDKPRIILSKDMGIHGMEIYLELLDPEQKGEKLLGEYINLLKQDGWVQLKTYGIAPEASLDDYAICKFDESDYASIQSLAIDYKSGYVEHTYTYDEGKERTYKVVLELYLNADNGGQTCNYLRAKGAEEF
jgi:hypothetical protein